MSACTLTDPDFPQCCCNCKLHLTDYKHCTIHAHPPGQCVCNEVKGFVCLIFADEGIVHSEWPEHMCGCEGYYPRHDHKTAIGLSEYGSWFK